MYMFRPLSSLFYFNFFFWEIHSHYYYYHIFFSFEKCQLFFVFVVFCVLHCVRLSACVCVCERERFICLREGSANAGLVGGVYMILFGKKGGARSIP
jgi:hypothetical protein